MQAWLRRISVSIKRWQHRRKSTERKEPRVLQRDTRWLLTFTVLIGAVVALWFIAANVVPFNPYTPTRYSVIPPRACPNGPIKVEIDRQVATPLWGKKGNYMLEQKWINVKDGTRILLPTEYGTLANTKDGLDTIVSPIIRTAPSLPGRWRLNVKMTVDGSVLGWPRQAPSDKTSVDILQTLSSETKGCS